MSAARATPSSSKPGGVRVGVAGELVVPPSAAPDPVHPDSTADPPSSHNAPAASTPRRAGGTCRELAGVTTRAMLPDRRTPLVPPVPALRGPVPPVGWRVAVGHRVPAVPRTHRTTRRDGVEERR